MIGAAKLAVGGLSNPSKMPGFGYSLPAEKCGAGSKLRAVPGSTCSSCYAMKGRYAFGNVKEALARRFEAINDPEWVANMTRLVAHYGKASSPFFRWHDSGDIQNVAHLSRIFDIAEATPDVAHWLPTREYRMVKTLLARRAVPSNLTIRLSAHMIDGAAAPDIAGTVTSSVHDKAPAVGHECPAPKQGNSCGDCRACWSTDVANVSYHVH